MAKLAATLPIYNLKLSHRESPPRRLAWIGTGTIGRQTASLPAAVALALGRAGGARLGSTLPAWFAELLSRFTVACAADVQSGVVARFAVSLARLHDLTPEAWHKLDYACRAAIVREAASHSGSNSAQGGAARVLALLARAEAGDMPAPADWPVGFAQQLVAAARTSAVALTRIATDWAARNRVTPRRTSRRTARADAMGRILNAVLVLLEAAILDCESTTIPSVATVAPHPSSSPAAALPALPELEMAYPAAFNPFALDPACPYTVGPPVVFRSSGGPHWLRVLTPWLTYARVGNVQPEIAARFANIGTRWHVLSIEGWQSLDYTFRTVAVREALRALDAGDAAPESADAVRHCLARTLGMLDCAAAGDLPGEAEWQAVRDVAASAQDATSASLFERRAIYAEWKKAADLDSPPPARTPDNAASAARVLRVAAAAETGAAEAAHAAARAAAWALKVEGPHYHSLREWHAGADARKIASEAHKATAQAAAHHSAARMALEMVGLLEKAVIEAELADVF